MNIFIPLNIKKLLLKSYLILTILVAALLPTLFLLTSTLSDLDDLNEVEVAISELAAKEEQLKGRGASEEAFLAKMQRADHSYIDKYLETLVFLGEEIAELEMQKDPLSKKRLEFLKSNNNRLLFGEDQIRKGSLFQEVEERLLHPVEMEEEDLKKMLSLIEETSPFPCVTDAPQLIIKHFELIKKSLSSEQEVFVISMQLIKREGL